MSAASVWLKFDINNTWLSPQIGEWCLWSMIIDGERNYFSGSLFKFSDESIRLYWDGYKTLKPDDTVYFARVNKINE